ncbi:MAG: DUF1501 domain-containing protein [Gemmataceae bacterium]|nr:DUF1501 domain-containing protein [Gemmataceae bacterium]
MFRLHNCRANRTGDGISRRHFLHLGLGIAGLSLADVLRLQAQQTRTAHKAVVMVVLQGGPPHIDMYDMKPEAPVEIRGEFKPIHTNVSGIDICELMPMQTRIADKLAIVRNTRFYGDHYGTEMFTGFHRVFERSAARNLRPAFGSVVSKLRPGTGMPPYVSLIGETHHMGVDEDPEYLGVAHRPFRGQSGTGLDNLGLCPDLSLNRLAEREKLRAQLDTLRRDLDGRAMDGMDANTARALDIITANKARQAFDVSREPDRIRQKYGTEAFQQRFLQARRLVEAGVSVVTLEVGGFDTHAANFTQMRRTLPKLDQAIHAFVTDLHDRGLNDDVLLIVWGEMGRTPRINNNQGGRDHWGRGFTLLAGGGLKTGQVVGATDGNAAEIKGAFYTPQNVLATAYQVLGIDPADTLRDNAGRPQYLLDERETIAELL